MKMKTEEGDASNARPETIAHGQRERCHEGVYARGAIAEEARIREDDDRERRGSP